jgi:hypothetical protein
VVIGVVVLVVVDGKNVVLVVVGPGGTGPGGVGMNPEQHG